MIVSPSKISLGGRPPPQMPPMNITILLFINLLIINRDDKVRERIFQYFNGIFQEG